MKPSINFNGKIAPADKPLFTAHNRSFRYGDALFETIRVINGTPQFIEKHIERLKIGMKFLKMDISSEYTPDYFNQLIIELSKNNNIQKDARVRLSVFRNNGGYYTPLTNEVSFLIEIENNTEMGYVLNKDGYKIDVFQELTKNLNSLSFIKSANGLVYVLAGIYKKQHDLDECIILNNQGNVAEAISSNIFTVKNGVLYTPPLSEACVNGIMRQQIINIAKENRIAVYENPIALNVLLNSDELFLTNAINGIRWVGQYKEKQYSNTTSVLLVEKLNSKCVN